MRPISEFNLEARHRNPDAQAQIPIPKGRRWAARGALCAIWVLLSFEELIKYLHLWPGLVVCIAFPFVAAIILAKLSRGLESHQARIVAIVLVAGWIFGTAAYFALHGINQSAIFRGHGSDRENALQTACQALLAGKFPYSHLTILKNPITPMPGALILAIPFYLIGHTGLQNLFWLAAFMFACYRLLGGNWGTAWFVYLFVLLNPCIMQDFVTGGDFFTNFVYVMVTFSLTIHALTSETPTWKEVVCPLLLGIALSSRPIYSLLYPCIVAFGLQARGMGRGLRTAGLVLLAVVSVTIAIYLRDPAHFTPLNVGSLAYSFIPASLHPALLTFIIGLAVASTSFFVCLNFSRLCLILGCTLTVVTLPFFILDRIMRPELFPLINLIYLSPGLLLLAIWLLPFAVQGSSAVATRTVTNVD
jgi:hypothetical protein